jgi:creatinine amidohydrolase
MARAPIRRSIGNLTSPEIARALKDTSILALPLGAIEQHGPHLPLETDLVVAQWLTATLSSAGARVRPLGAPHSRSGSREHVGRPAR